MNSTYLSSEKFRCISCDYSTSRNSQYHRHLMTPKHQNNTNVPPKKVPLIKQYECHCGKVYKYHSGLWTHRQKACNIKDELDTSANDLTHAVIEIVKHNQEMAKQNQEMAKQNQEMAKQNQEFKELVVEQNKQIIDLVAKVGSVGNSLTMNNSNNTNNKFSLNFFLNETCKDALNISDFVKLVKYDVPELEMVGKLGYAEGISQIFLNSLKSIESNKRPIWCSDEKREVMHIKENGAWEKDGEDLNKTKKLLSQITKKFHYPLNDWRAKNPSYKDPDHKKSDEYVFMLQQAMGGAKGQDHEHNKIIKRIIKKVMVKREHNEI